MQIDLFTPLRLGRYDLPHRIAMAPMTRGRAPDALPSDLVRTYYEQRASAALIVTEGIAPEPLGLGYRDTPGLYSSGQVSAWKRVTDAVHARGGRIFAQIMHTGRISHPDFLGGRTPVAPSAVRPAGLTWTPEGQKPFATPRYLKVAEILKVIEGYRRAASLAVEAGFDGVEIHGANGYLPHQFLSTNANVRTDDWGGSVENRARFLLAATAASAAAIGADRVGVRLSPGNRYNDIAEEGAEATYAYVARRLDAMNLSYLHVVDSKPGFAVAPLIRRNYRGTVILNGGYDRARADADIASGLADLVAFGNAFLANPDLPERLRTGAPLSTADPSTFYTGGARGYTDYPSLRALARAA
jgi:N-ethylmaleimide reductase